ncbi:hypothetical protein [Marinagarivorans algicola]|uniref:hypothetical protein n=1 Tax=Marinagarivorans algicola TaxID=1513270 RepID=UPI0006B63BA9|nr:hypothetical protein [Marinagarivorans algicola]
MGRYKNNHKAVERREQSIPAPNNDLEHAITALHQTITKLNKMIDKVAAQEAAKKTLLADASPSRVLH